MNSLELLKTAIAGALLLGTQTTTAQTPPPVEKCYGIVAAGKNDCQTAASSCAGSSKQDKQPDAWIYLPTGTCSKISGGSLSPKTTEGQSEAE